MKLFLKILLLIFTMCIIIVGEAKSSTVINVVQEVSSYSFLLKLRFNTNIFENHSANSYLKGEEVVTCSEQGKKEEGVAKTGTNAAAKG